MVLRKLRGRRSEMIPELERLEGDDATERKRRDHRTRPRLTGFERKPPAVEIRILGSEVLLPQLSLFGLVKPEDPKE